MATKFGRQPARDILFLARISVADAAKQIGVSRLHLTNALHGWITPCPAVREQLPNLLNRPLEELFTPEVLARPFWSRWGVK